jgi:hypothetical protein
MKHFLSVLLLVCLALVAGCSTQPAQISQDELTHIPAGHGLLVASYARPSPTERFSIESVYYRKRGQKTGGEIGINVLPYLPLTFDFQEPESSGSLFIASLPSGDYEFYSFYVEHTIFGGQAYLRPAHEFSVPFKVEAGKACYIGELKMFRLRMPNRVLGMPIKPDNVRLELSDQSGRDLALFKKKYPESALPVIIALPSAVAKNPYLIVK